jgi:hypothetical protein
MPNRHQIKGILLVIVGIAAVLDALGRMGAFHYYLDWWSVPKYRVSIGERYVGSLCIGLGLWLYRSNSNRD